MTRRRIVIQSSDRSLEQITRALSAYAPLAERGFRQILLRASRRALEELRSVPERVKYPIEWTSERQRRAFFATDGFGRGIPTKRTGVLVAGWRSRVRGYRRGADLNLWNNVPYEAFVTGIHQQKFHKNTGWGQSGMIFEQTAERAENELIAFSATLLQQLLQGNNG